MNGDHVYIIRSPQHQYDSRNYLYQKALSAEVCDDLWCCQRENMHIYAKKSCQQQPIATAINPVFGILLDDFRAIVEENRFKQT